VGIGGRERRPGRGCEKWVFDAAQCTREESGKGREKAEEKSEEFNTENTEVAEEDEQKEDELEIAGEAEEITSGGGIRSTGD